eukprot:965694-Prymnesium_polylepis.1
MLSGSPWRGALERWFGGPTRSPTSPKVSLVHDRPYHNLKQHNYEPSRLLAQHHLDPPPKAPRGAS